ncbi:MAG TPA: hypothetical protein VGU22_11515 [Methylomirabilota bacterium]|jgi:hypothetical protein|nr:hypothetical protein [Methylomirabilota bacterium]
MRRSILCLIAVAAFVGPAALAVAQQPSQAGPMQTPRATPPSSTMPAPPHETQHAQHMEMCRQMMGQPGMMGGGMRPGMMRGEMGSGMMSGMMGMPMMMGGDPKQQAEMMAMRGEMMKAMGDIMMKYAQRIQSTN